MKAELLKKRTRDALREYFVDWGSLRIIRNVFDEALIDYDFEYVTNVSGERRTLVEQYYSTLDFTDWTDVNKLLRVFETVIIGSDERDKDDIDKIVRYLENDGFRLENNQILSQSQSLISLQLASDVVQGFDAQHMMQQIRRIENSIEHDPDLAIGSAKELLESCCKTILEDRGVSIRRNANMPTLIAEVRKELNLLPDDIPNATKGKEHIDLVLDGLANAATGMYRLRNLYGTGHGKYGHVSSVKPRHAKLAVGAATTIVIFFYETHLETLQSD